jgi:hypothetical protein
MGEILVEGRENGEIATREDGAAIRDLFLRRTRSRRRCLSSA